jgi:integrase
MYQSALNDLKDQGFARTTIEGVHTTAKMIFKMAVSKRILKIDPTTNAYIKKDEQIIIESDEEELPVYFEKEELALFLKAVYEHGLFMDVLIFITLSYTGMRVGELVALKWKDIDFKKYSIRITKTYYNPKNNTKEYLLVPPKTKKSRRKIMIDDVVIEAFRKHKEEQETMITRFGKFYNDNGFLFANLNRHPGYPVLIKFIESRMARILNKVDLNSDLTPHSLRHTHTSLLAEAKVALEQIMDRLGHSNDQITKNVYLHVTQEMKKEASQKFGELMRSLR